MFANSQAFILLKPVCYDINNIQATLVFRIQNECPVSDMRRVEAANKYADSRFAVRPLHHTCLSL